MEVRTTRGIGGVSVSRNMELANFSFRPFVHDQIEKIFFSLSATALTVAIIQENLCLLVWYSHFSLKTFRDSDLGIGL